MRRTAAVIMIIFCLLLVTACADTGEGLDGMSAAVDGSLKNCLADAAEQAGTDEYADECTSAAAGTVSGEADAAAVTATGEADTSAGASEDSIQLPTTAELLYTGTDIGSSIFGEIMASTGYNEFAATDDWEPLNTGSDTGTGTGDGTEYADADIDVGDSDDMTADSEEVDVDAEPIEEIVFLKLYYKGISDKSVAYIQQTLMDLGFMDPAEPTEYYGSATMEAVRLFQRQNDLKQDGIAGEQTLGLLLSPDAKHYMVKLGMEGTDISRIQQRLYELGYLASKNNINGTFDSDTDKAVKSLQQANGLSVDGKVGEMTFELMYSDDVVANLMSFGDKGEVVLVCQQRLKELGYLTTTPDGSYGSDTLAAVKLFQSRNDLIVDGYLGPSTREALDSPNAVANGLVIGDEGDTVKRVQQLLIKYGYMSSGSDTGYFGEVTDKAVKAFQKNNGLSVDGNVGVKTMAKLTGDSVVRSDGTGTGSGKVDTGSTSSGSVAKLLEVAKSKLGCKYVWAAKGPNQFDCSGFVYWCLNQVGVKQSYITSYGWRTVGKYKKIANYKDLKAGDIIVVTGHVGIIAENGTVIDASSSQGKIVHRSLSTWWSSRFIVGWRIFE